MDFEEPTHIEGLEITGYKDHDYDFGYIVAKQTDRIMEAGRNKHLSATNLNVWIDAINDMEDLLFGFWTDKDIKTTYIEELKSLRNVKPITTEDKIELAHAKMRLLMKLQFKLKFQGMKRGRLRT